MRIRIRIIMIFAVLLMLGGCSFSAVAGTEKVMQIKSVVTEVSEDTTENAIEDMTSDEVAEASRDVFAMDTYMTVKAYGTKAEEAVNAAVAEIERLDAMLSTGNKNSEVAGLNSSGSGVLSEETAELMERSLELYQSTDGAFDIAIYPVMKAWGFTDGKYQVPSADLIAALLELADPSLIEYDSESRSVFFRREGVQIDFGGIAKGFTSARIMDIYREYGITSGLVNLGGNVQVLGTKTDGSNWRIAVQSPDSSEDYIGVLSASDCAVITSGGYERFFEENGTVYHHIIDPDTGYPADNGLISVSIVSMDGTLADGLSTALFVMGMDQAVEYWRLHSDEFDMILVNDAGNVYVSEGIETSFTSNREIQIIEKDGLR